MSMQITDTDEQIEADSADDCAAFDADKPVSPDGDYPDEDV